MKRKNQPFFPQTGYVPVTAFAVDLSSEHFNSKTVKIKTLKPSQLMIWILLDNIFEVTQVSSLDSLGLLFVEFGW